MPDTYSNALPQGTLLQGRSYSYRIERVLGQGSFGITYLATANIGAELGSLEMKVAVKEFFMKDINDRTEGTVTGGSRDGLFSDYKRKFIREAGNLSRLKNHRHIVNVLEAFEANGTAYYVMEYIDGGSLDTRIGRQGGLPEPEALRLIGQIGSALSYMHDNRMLHLDMKPSNVMLRGGGEAVLIDFGLSKQYDDAGNPESSTAVGGGTPGYAPIEQSQYREGNGFPVTMDVYALGATLFKMLTGERPPEATIIFNDEFPRHAFRGKNVSDRTVSAVEKAMSPKRRQRYQSVREFLEVLGLTDSAGEETDLPPSSPRPSPLSPPSPSSPPPPPMPSPSTPPPPRKRSGVSGAFLFILIGAAVAVGILVGREKERIAAEQAEQENARRQQQNANLQIQMVYVQGGTFTMGATSEQGSEVYNDEKPAHRVTLSDYYIGKYEVTQGQWKAVMGGNPSDLEKGDNYPVENVSWNDIQEFIRKLNERTGKRYTLPTEAQWEYAARGGNRASGTKYSGSRSIDNVAWYCSNSGSTTHPVGTKSPNELGIYDMSGNVWEWCADWYGKDYYQDSLSTNPRGPSSGSCRVLRGGSWYSVAGYCRVSFRNCLTPDDRYDNLGFRLALLP